MKQNIAALLRARGLKQKDLADYCHKGETWISKILTIERREFPMKYFDRIADFLRVETYQLLQPGLTPPTERRKAQRRSGKDRRLAEMQQNVRDSLSRMTVTEEDVATLMRLKLLGPEDRKLVDQSLRSLPRGKRRPPTPSSDDASS